MNISQAIRRIKAITGEIAEVEKRAVASVTHEVEAVPAFHFSQLMEEREMLVGELVGLRARVAQANADKLIDDPSGGNQITLAAALHRLFQLKASIAFYDSLYVRDHAETEDRTTDQEWDEDFSKRRPVIRITKYVCHLPEAKKAERVRSLRKQFATLNDAVERANNATTLEE
jgi:hypothetical protein